MTINNNNKCYNRNRVYYGESNQIESNLLFSRRTVHFAKHLMIQKVIKVKFVFFQHYKQAYAPSTKLNHIYCIYLNSRHRHILCNLGQLGAKL